MAAPVVEVPTRAARDLDKQPIVENPTMDRRPVENLPEIRRKPPINLQIETEVLHVLKNNRQCTIFMAKLFRKGTALLYKQEEPLKFVAISDTHCRHTYLKLPKGDVLLHAGDVSFKGKRDEIRGFLAWFSKQNFQYKIFIAGNHDFYMEKAKKEEIDQLIPPGVTYLNDSGIEINGIKIWGSPVTPWFYNWAFNRHRGQQIRKHWELIPSGTDILITHGPAYGFLDITTNEQHVGCQDLLRHVLTLQPKIHLFGHIHESYGNIKRAGVQFMNASVVNEQYQLVNPPFVFEL